jgi:protein-S-isoprenylcysteine O-methyltransferase Ste14
MKRILMFAYSIIAYLIGFASLLLWILSVSQLVPEISIDRTPELSFPLALIKNIGLVLLFGLQHSIMARKSFKQWITGFIPQPVERSTFVLLSGVLLAFLVWQWEPLGGTIWNITAGTPLFYIMYALFFMGWSILFISTFLINHFDLFGLRQTYSELRKKPYTDLPFRVKAFYNYVRHPLYFGGILGLWATPTMTATHLCFALLLTGYFVIGSLFEEKDLVRDFGDQYRDYQKRTGRFVPLFSRKKTVTSAAAAMAGKGSIAD